MIREWRERNLVASRKHNFFLSYRVIESESERETLIPHPTSKSKSKRMAETAKKAVPEAEELPKTIVRRVVKDKLSHCSDDGDISVHKDALLAFSESARIFIHYISATANDICKESKRQIINADDVFKALEETEFPEFIRPLKASLEEFRKKNAGKKAAVSKGNGNETKKKRKLEGDSADKDEGGDSQ